MRPPRPLVPSSVAVLEPFVAAEVLGAGEVQVAAAVARLRPATDPLVLLAVAVAARAPALGHVGIELDAVADRLRDRLDRDLGELPWPALDRWRAALAASDVVAEPAAHLVEPLAPLVWDGRRIYLHRYWCYEELVAREVRERAGRGSGAGVGGSSVAPDAELDAALDALFPAGDGGVVDRQRVAARLGLTAHLSVVAGGPGTGKTRTVARLLAAARAVGARAGRPVEVALAAPTGKAAARMTDAVHQAVAEARADGVLTESVAATLLATEATTIHALLGWAPGTRFRHDRLDPLPHDLVVVDETSMVSLPLMARLLAAVRPDARVVLVGDPDQLASVDAGTVLADLVGIGPDATGADASGTDASGGDAVVERGSAGTPVAPTVPDRVARSARSSRTRAPADDPAAPRLFAVDGLDPALASPSSEVPAGSATGPMVAAADAVDGTGAPLRGRITVLDRVYRFGGRSGIAELADAVRTGSVGQTLGLLDGSRPDVRWVRPDEPAALSGLTEEAAAAAVAVVDAALAGSADEALAAAHRIKVLAATRHGEHGLRWWTDRLEAAVAAARPAVALGARWYVGRPVLVTQNDPVNRVANGDVGVVVAEGTGVAVALPQGPDVRTLPVSRLHDVDTWWAMTIHKSQGSEFPHVVVSLPEAGSPILTRELLYTAVTRAKERVTIVASEAALRSAIETPVARASGLGPRLWPSS